MYIQYFFHLVNMKCLSPFVAQAGASRQAGCRSSSIFSTCSFNFNSSNCCSNSLFFSTCFTCFSSNLLTSDSHDKVPLQAPDNLRLFPLAFILFPERNTKLFPVHFEVHLSSLDCLLIRVFYCQLWKFACSLFLLVLRQNARDQLIDVFRIFWVLSICYSGLVSFSPSSSHSFLMFLSNRRCWSSPVDARVESQSSTGQLHSSSTWAPPSPLVPSAPLLLCSSSGRGWHRRWRPSPRLALTLPISLKMACLTFNWVVF